MSRKIVIASAGAGKTQRIVSEAEDYVRQGFKILVITYTENNQRELESRFSTPDLDRNKYVIKGLYRFLLEDIVRPYQRCVLGERIETINFNSNGDPHKLNGRTIPGRTERLACGSVNPEYYLTQSRKKAHTTYLSKLASKILELKRKEIIERFERIYKHVYFDEVQDLVGWDYQILEALSKSPSILVTCVGDFRQTIYETSVASKGPKTTAQKIDKFKSMKFNEEHLAVSNRSVQSICDYADKIHSNEDYKNTISNVTEIPDKFCKHIGVFCVSESKALAYIHEYNPVLLRHGVTSGKIYNGVNIKKYNFGKSKGLGFNRVLIVPTQPYIKYILGDYTVFDSDRSEESKNKLYVAVTRARYSVAFILPDVKVAKCDLPQWTRG